MDFAIYQIVERNIIGRHNYCDAERNAENDYSRNLVVIVLTDNAYGMVKWKQINMGFSDFGLDIGNPDFVTYANSYGAHGHRLSAAEELIPQLELCFKTAGVHLIEVPIDYSDNDRILNHEIAEKSKFL